AGRGLRAATAARQVGDRQASDAQRLRRRQGRHHHDRRKAPARPRRAARHGGASDHHRLPRLRGKLDPMSTQPFYGHPTLAELAAALRDGRTTSRALTDEALARIADPAGEGKRAFLRVYAEQARAAADAQDNLRHAGIAGGPLAGLPISIKDLFDVAGEPTTAGSKALRDAPPARHDAPIVARLRAAGAVIVGKSNMTEFAYS